MKKGLALSIIVILALSAMIVRINEKKYTPYKTEQTLRSKNLAMPDLTDKKHLGNGVYRLYDSDGITLDYNIYNGNYVLNGTSVVNTTIILTTLPIIQAGQTVSRSTYYVSGSIDLVSFTMNNPMSMTDTSKNNIDINYNNNKAENTITSGNNNARRLMFYILGGRTFDNFTFKLQLEKGSEATPYTVPNNKLYNAYTSYKDNLHLEEKIDVGLMGIASLTDIIKTVNTTLGYSKKVIKTITDFLDKTKEWWNIPITVPVIPIFKW